MIMLNWKCCEKEPPKPWEFILIKPKSMDTIDGAYVVVSINPGHLDLACDYPDRDGRTFKQSTHLSEWLPADTSKWEVKK